MQKVIVGLSGGVDSAVAALLLRQSGADVLGVTMSIWDESLPRPKEGAGGCLGPEEADIASAQSLASALQIPFKVIDCVEEYKNIVLGNFKAEYASGRTPNPCVWCNSLVKFGALPAAAKRAGVAFDKFATGHYAIIGFDAATGRWQLKKGASAERDQSYFLYRLSQEQLATTLFPLGAYTKVQVRELAAQAGLSVAQKPDSQDFYCGDYNDVLKFPPKPGDIVDSAGKVIGRHEGIWNYTIGKRKGITGGGTDKPLYVVRIDAPANRIIAGYKEDLFSRDMFVGQVNWVSMAEPAAPVRAAVKIRRQHQEAAATITPLPGARAKVVFDEPQMSITAGQSAVFYAGDTVLGGGVIE